MNVMTPSIFRLTMLGMVLSNAAFCAVVQINGTCINAASCTNPTPLLYAPGTAQNGTANASVTVGSDSYSFSSSYSTGVHSSGGTFINFYPILTYTGSAPAATADTITVDLFSNIYDAAATSYNGTYTETVPLVVPANATASGQLFVDGQGVGLAGPYGPGSYSPTISNTLTNVNGATLQYDYQFIFNFAAGSLPGSGVSSPAAAPEPAQTIPTALVVAGLALIGMRRRVWKV